ncbi:MAG: alpha/beta hydrolase [Candidatus Hermodarchaeota archaeon]
MSEKRYVVETIQAKSLENNPLNSPSERELHIYLPPNYFDSNKRYPVIYFLNGYSGNNKKLAVSPRIEDNLFVFPTSYPPEIKNQIDFDRLPSYVKFDELITTGELPPFIFVEPDGSLHLPHKLGVKEAWGDVKTKGCFYVNSPFTGNYEDYIVNDVVGYMDKNYRTIQDKQHRAIMGLSMGGVGTLSIISAHANKFNAAASISPAEVTIDNIKDFLDFKLIPPLFAKLLGKEMAKQAINAFWVDALDTVDLIYSKDNPLVSSIEQDATGKIVRWNQQASENWQKYDLINKFRDNSEALKDVHILLNCEKTDDFGCAWRTQTLHEALVELGIDHKYDLYSDPKAAALSAHYFGCLYSILPSIGFCLQHLT